MLPIVTMALAAWKKRQVTEILNSLVKTGQSRATVGRSKVMLFLSVLISHQELCNEKTVVQIFGIRAVVICQYGTGPVLKMQVKSTIDQQWPYLYLKIREKRHYFYLCQHKNDGSLLSFFQKKLDTLKSESCLFICNRRQNFHLVSLEMDTIKELPSCWCLPFTSHHLTTGANWSE